MDGRQYTTSRAGYSLGSGVSRAGEARANAALVSPPMALNCELQRLLQNALAQNATLAAFCVIAFVGKNVEILSRKNLFHSE
jgi:hypothetical protein